jgi:antitoxin MazE
MLTEILRYLHCNYNGSTDMKARIVRIGNSRGIRLPKPLILEAGLSDQVDLHVHEGTIVIRPIAAARSGWAESAKALHDRGEDSALQDAAPTLFEQNDWRWDR